MKRALIAVCAVVFGGFALGATAQDTTEAPPAAASPAPSPGATLQGMIEGEQEMLSGGGYTYDPRGRRDPFRSLLSGGAVRDTGPRPEGVAGLLIEELDLQGVWRSKQGMVAQVRSSDNKSYLLKVGDKVFNGEVTAIDKDRLVLKQVVNDPLAVKPFMEVVKELVPGKR